MRAVAKYRRFDLKAMTEEELHALIRECSEMEQRLKAPYAKGRRTWTRQRAAAEQELAMRSGERAR